MREIEFKGTKTDWEIIKRNEPYHNGLDIKNVCMLYQVPEDNEHEDIYNANALLISKAPEMLQALITTLEELEDINVLENHRNYLEQLIKQATEL